MSWRSRRKRKQNARHRGPEPLLKGAPPNPLVDIDPEEFNDLVRKDITVPRGDRTFYGPASEVFEKMPGASVDDWAIKGLSDTEAGNFMAALGDPYIDPVVFEIRAPRPGSALIDGFRINLTPAEAVFLLRGAEHFVDDAEAREFDLSHERWCELMSWLGNTAAEIDHKEN